MYRNNYRKLRPAQSGQPVCATDKPALQPQPPPKSIKESIFMIKGFCVGQPVCATNMPALRPQPPAKRNPGGIVTVKELNLRESVKLPPIFDPHNTERYPLASVYGIGVDLRKAELHRQERYDSYLQHSNVAQPINQEKSAVSERLWKAKNDRARCDAKLKPRSKQPIAPKTTKAAQDLMRRTQEREEIEACESEVCDSEESKESQVEDQKIRKRRNIGKSFLREQDKMLEEEESVRKEMEKNKEELKKMTSELPLLEIKISQQEAEKSALSLEIRELEMNARETRQLSFQCSRLTGWIQDTFDKVMDRTHPEIKYPMRQMEMIRDFFHLERNPDLRGTAFIHPPEARIPQIHGKCISLTRKPIAPKTTKAAQDLMRRTQEREEKACESEVCDSDGESADSDDDVACQYMNFVADHERVLERYQREKEKIKEKMDAFREQMDQIRKLEVKNTKDIIHMKEQLQYLQFCKCDPITMRKKIRELCEKLSEFYLETLGRFCSPSFPYVMLTDLEEWLLQKMEVMSPERLRKIRKQLFKAYDTTLRKQKEAEMEELRAERREKRRERAFAPPPPKITGKKLMPRSPPPKKVMKKEEPVKTKNQD